MSAPHRLRRTFWRYPVSSMAGEQLAEARVEAGGIAGDRWEEAKIARNAVKSGCAHKPINAVRAQMRNRF